MGEDGSFKWLWMLLVPDKLVFQKVLKYQRNHVQGLQYKARERENILWWKLTGWKGLIPEVSWKEGN